MLIGVNKLGTQSRVSVYIIYGLMQAVHDCLITSNTEIFTILGW